MTKQERYELDAKVLAAVRSNGKARASKINEAVGPGYDMREVDRSLQRLRKGGKLAYESRTGWQVA